MKSFQGSVNAEYTRIQNHDSYPCEIPEQEHDIYLDVVSSLNDLTAFPFDSEAKGKAL